jgi:short-subunit dehydrogenase
VPVQRIVLDAATLPEAAGRRLQGVAMSFKDQTVVITGASSGIGWELARQLGAQQGKIGLLARRQDKLAELAGAIQQAGGKAAYVPVDITDRTQVLEAIGQLRAQLGPIDLLIANAGVGAPTLLEPMNVGDVEKMYRVNVFGVIYAIEAVLPEMRQRKHGHLAAVSSLAAYKGLPGESGYTSSKAAISNYMEGLRIHLRGSGVHVTTICPGFVRTPMTDVNDFHMPWLLEAGDAARRILRALRWKRKVYNFPWQMSLIMKLTRWLPDWVVARMMGSYNENPPMPKTPL